jgi:hypothetical protein
MADSHAIANAITNLRAHNIEVRLVESREECRVAVLETIPAKSTVGLGGSTTVQQIGLLDALAAGDYKVFNQYEQGISKEENQRRRRAGLTAQYYVTGVNAISEQGELFFLDGIGNRVAAVSYGPEKVILAAGVNKICRDERAAWARIREKAAPPNAKRFGADTPCRETGKCVDCEADARICNIYVKIHRAMTPGRITLFLINQNLGF